MNAEPCCMLNAGGYGCDCWKSASIARLRAALTQIAQGKNWGRSMHAIINEHIQIASTALAETSRDMTNPSPPRVRSVWPSPPPEPQTDALREPAFIIDGAIEGLRLEPSDTPIQIPNRIEVMVAVGTSTSTGAGE